MQQEFLKQLYFRELDGRFQHDARTGSQVTQLSLVGGALALLIRAAWPIDSSLGLIAELLSAIGVCFLVAAIVFVIRATLGYQYESLPSPSELYEHWRGLHAHYATNPEAQGTAEDDFADFLQRHMAQAATRNWTNNLSRSGRQHRASQFLAWAIALVVLGGVALAIDKALQAFQGGTGG